MKLFSFIPMANVVKIALGAILVAGVTGVAFASWIDKGAGIFMTMVESGLAWCF